jgi:protein SCO1/2
MQKTRRPLCLLALFLTFGPWVAGAPAAQTGHEEHHHESQPQAGADPHAHHRAMMAKPAEAAQAAQVDLRDIPLTDQDGRELRFASDVIGDRVVVVNFVYTTCTTVCPVLSALFGQIQQRLGDRLGDQVSLVSLSVDPSRDTPQRLNAYAESQEARPGWVWLTGRKSSVDQVLEGLDAYTPNFEDHAPMVLVGDGRTGEWVRFFGFPSPERIMEKVDALLAARTETPGS